jgi:hypothetical protein
MRCSERVVSVDRVKSGTILSGMREKGENHNTKEVL